MDGGNVSFLVRLLDARMNGRGFLNGGGRPGVFLEVTFGEHIYRSSADETVNEVPEPAKMTVRCWVSKSEAKAICVCCVHTTV